MELVLYGSGPVMEMKHVDQIIPLRYTKEKLSLPYIKEDRFHNMEVLFLNTSIDGIAKVINNNHPMIRNIGKIINAYYYDHTSLYRCIKSPMIPNSGVTISKGKAQRFSDYDLISSKVDGIYTPFNLAQIQGKNFIYDLQPIIRTLKAQRKLNKVPLLTKMRVYFDTIYSALDHNLSSSRGNYLKSPIFVNLDEYENNTKPNDYHILTYILLVLKKSEKMIAEFQSDYKIIFYTDNGYLLFDMRNDFIKDNYNRFKLGINRLKPSIVSDKILDSAIKEDISNQMNLKMGFSGNTSDLDDLKDIEVPKEENPIVDDEFDVNHPKSVQKSDDDVIRPNDTVVKKVATMIGEDDLSDESDEKLNEIIQNINDDESLKKELADVVIKRSIGTTSKASTARDAELRKRQKDITIKNHTIGELTKKYDVPKIQKTNIQGVKTINDGVKNVQFTNFQKTYNEELMERDIANTFTMFNDKSIDMNVVSVKVEDTSDTLNLKDTYTIVFEDEFRRRHTVKVNIPKMVDNQFLYINGGLKTIETQITGLPVIKTAEDTVYVTTNYNKIEIKRVGSKFNPNMERFRKILADPKMGYRAVKGNNTNDNKKYITCLEYDEMASKYTSIDHKNCHFVFNVQLLMDYTDHEYENTLDKILVGYRTKGSTKEPIFYDRNNPDHIDLISMMIMESDPELYETFKTMSSGKRFMYTQTKIMRSPIPTVVLICFFEGISTVIHKFNDPNVTFVDKPTQKDKYNYIRFSDGYLSYPMSDMEACIMFNGLTAFNTSAYSFSDLDDRQTYIDIFEEITGNGYIAGALVNFYDFMIDPITKELLEMYFLPTDLVSLIIYANNLLADNQFTTDLHMSNYRFRNNEIIVAILYKQLSIAYARYRATARNNNPVKISLNPDCVIKELQAVPTVQDYSQLGPITEIKTRYNASMRGYSGLNLEDAYKMSKRAYDDSMIGIVGMSTDNAKNCGKERHLVLEPNVINARGILEVTDKKDIKDLPESKLETPAEMLNPNGLLHDDPVRTAMAVKQRGHIIPIEDQCPMLVTNGMDATIQYRTSSQYSVVAEKDGKVIDINHKLKLMTIQYKDGTKRAIDLYPNMAKNSGGGMYIKNQLITTFKAGDTFKKDAVLAYDPYYYQDNPLFGNRLVYGTLVKTAIASNAATYEDSDFFTRSLSKRMASKITMCKKVVVGKNANIDYIIKRGNEIKIGEELIRFETSYNDDELNKLLAGIRDDLHEAIVSLGKTRISAKYEGVIDDIVCYPTVPLEEMSPSLAKVVKECQTIDKSRAEYLDKFSPETKNSPYKAGCLLTRAYGIVEPDQYGKIDGEDVMDSVMFKFYITYLDEISDGDKLVHMTANKATMGDMIPEGFEPYTEFRPYEEISMFQPPSAILQRGTQSIEATMLTYKALIETKRKMYEILTGEDWNTKQMRDNPYMVKDSSRKNVSESINIESIPDDHWLMLESIYDLGESSNGEIIATRFYEPGDIVMMCSIGDNITFESYVEKFTNGDSKNITLDKVNGRIIVTEAIYPGEPFIM